MPSSTIIPFSELASSDLRVDAVYQGGRAGNAGDDPFPALLSMSNQGGFRFRGKLNGVLEMVLLTSTFNDPDWPDDLDRETGIFTYYGDNKKPGRLLHDTPRGGNMLLRHLFDAVHRGASGRRSVPPVFLFARAGDWRDVTFLGLAVPGVSGYAPDEDLVAVWRTANGERFQNYRARFTVLDVPVVDRRWLDELIARRAHPHHAPEAWHDWVETGRRRALVAARSIEYRTPAEQLPADPEGRAMISAVQEHFRERPHAFEHFAAAIARLAAPDIASLDVTRPSRDGGRDGVGKFRIGQGVGSILVDFALEAKCYTLPSSVGVKDLSRLISRLRHRQFGILVTTTYLALQAYREIKEDQHPILVIAAADIVSLLRSSGRSNRNAVAAWLAEGFPHQL
jgi:hypothetical protein